MNFRILTSKKFVKELKRLTKKYYSLKNEYASLIEILRHNPFYGTAIRYDCYKIRLSIASKGKGKSGGARVITYAHINGETIYLLTIFDKSETESISDKELEKLLGEIPDNLL